VSNQPTPRPRLVIVDGVPMSALVAEAPEPKAVILAIHGGGTTAELIVPAVLVFAAGDHPWRWALIGFMVIFHLNIISNFPMGVPLEWNVFFIFSLFYLFGHYGSITIYDLNSPLLLAMLLAALLVVPIVGNMFPQQISFLPSLRYYAGNWASSVWCFRDVVEDKIEADETTEIILLDKRSPLDDDRLIEAFGLAFQSLVGKLITEVEAYILARSVVRIIRLPEAAMTQAERRDMIRASVRLFRH